jgi:hypothetical protein
MANRCKNGEHGLRGKNRLGVAVDRVGDSADEDQRRGVIEGIDRTPPIADKSQLRRIGSQPGGGRST